MTHYPTKTDHIYNIVASSNGIKCSQVVNIMKLKQNIVSGLLSRLKSMGRIYNRDAKWYITSTNIVTIIEHKLLDINYNTKFNCDWGEGYISALIDYNIIIENEFERLLSFIKNYR